MGVPYYYKAMDFDAGGQDHREPGRAVSRADWGRQLDAYAEVIRAVAAQTGSGGA